MQGHSEIIWAIEVHGNRVYTASADKTVRVWDLGTKRCLQARRCKAVLRRPPSALPRPFPLPAAAADPCCPQLSPALHLPPVMAASEDYRSVC
jgi:WD40 repeat protein